MKPSEKKNLLESSRNRLECISLEEPDEHDRKELELQKRRDFEPKKRREPESKKREPQQKKRRDDEVWWRKQKIKGIKMNSGTNASGNQKKKRRKGTERIQLLVANNRQHFLTLNQPQNLQAFLNQRRNQRGRTNSDKRSRKSQFFQGMNWASR